MNFVYRKPYYSYWIFLLIGINIWISAPMFASINNFSAPNSINTYLSSTKTTLIELENSGEYPKEIIHIVMGNQSADMDSIVSAIVLAYVR